MHVSKEVFLLGLYFLYKVFVFRILSDTAPVSHLRLDFIDVGQGDAILLTTVNGNTILVDGGPDFEIDAFISEHMVFLPCNLTAIVLTHPHSDHLVGLNRILERCNVDTVFYNKIAYETGDYDYFIKLASTHSVRTLQLNDVFSVDDVTFKVLWPNSAFQKEYKDVNDASIVLLVSYSTTRILLTGDASSAPLSVIEPMLPKLDILKVSHHGSKTAFFKNLYINHAPINNVVMVGKSNFYHLPNMEVINFINSLGYKIYRTDDLGNITFKF